MLRNQNFGINVSIQLEMSLDAGLATGGTKNIFFAKKHMRVSRSKYLSRDQEIKIIYMDALGALAHDLIRRRRRSFQSCRPGGNYASCSPAKPGI